MGKLEEAYNRMVTSLKENSRNIVLYPEFGSDLSQILSFMEDYFKKEPKPIEVKFKVISNGNVDIRRGDEENSVVDSGVVEEDSSGAGSDSSTASDE